MFISTRRTRAALVAGAALAAVVAPAAAHATAPSAVPPLNVSYDANGTATVAKTGSSVKLGPTVLTTSLDAASGNFTGHLPIPQTSTEFKAFGFAPVSAKIDFIEAAPVTGKLGRDGTRTVVSSTAKYTLKLTDVKVGGFPGFVGDKCQTTEPISVPANTPAGESFSVATGGHLTGEFTIGKFANCGFQTGIINSLVPGPGNKIDLTLNNGRIG